MRIQKAKKKREKDCKATKSLKLWLSIGFRWRFKPIK